MKSLAEVPTLSILYCVEFENGLIKVGISKNARSRLKSIESTARSKINRKILFPGWVALEPLVKYHFRDCQAFGTEWFKGLKYESVVNEIYGMIYDDLEVKRLNNELSEIDFEDEVKEIMREIIDREVYLEDDALISGGALKRIQSLRESLESLDITAKVLIFPRLGYRMQILASDQVHFRRVIDHILS